MTLNDYCAYVSGCDERFRKSRLLIVPNPQNRQHLRTFYKHHSDSRVVRLSEAISTNAFLPMPGVVLLGTKDLIQAANDRGKMAFVTGLDGYFLLLDDAKITEAYGVLRTLLEDESLQAVFLLSNLDEHKSGSLAAYPRFREDRSVVQIGEGNAIPVFPEQNIVLVRGEFMLPGHATVTSIQEFLRSLEDEIVENGPVCVSVDSAYSAIPGVNQSIGQILTLKDYARGVCGFDEDTSEETLQWLYNRLRENGAQREAVLFLRDWFFPEGTHEYISEGPKKIREKNGPEREVLVWVLKKTISQDTYLYKVLSHQGLELASFSAFYVSKALDLLNVPNAAALSEERRKALKEIGYENLVPALSGFIAQCKAKPTQEIVTWLNNGTEIEKREIIRRVITDQGIEIAPAVRKSYALLDAYLESYSLGVGVLDDYFTQYRMQKLKNDVSSTFCQRAAQEEIPDELMSRDEIIQRYVADSMTGLLVVDALGAEYVPMILALAQRRGTGVQNMVVGYARIPTSTRYNEIAWPQPRRCPDVKKLDNIIHNGAEAHAATSIEENLMASLEAIEKSVLPAVEEALQHYARVILTSDHGASRLAVCAHEKGLSKTIDVPEAVNILDWRFSTAAATGVCPDMLTPSFCGNFWVVKGYNRLPKQGGKCYELHGGSTLEERLVPVIVFVKGAAFVPKVSKPACPEGEQLSENDDFDL